MSELKLKYSLTKIMQIIQLNFHSLNIYLFKHENPSDLINLFDTYSLFNNKNEFIELKAQLPLLNNGSYIPDPLFIYAKINKMNFTIRNELIDWLNYKPTRTDDELLNSLILELFDDYNYYDSVSQNNKSRQIDVSQSSLSSLKSSQNFRSIEVVSVSQSINNDSNLRIPKPNLIDTYYDLIKSFHLFISIEPVTLTFQTETNELIVFNMPKIDVKSIGVKFDLEEELINTWLVELPCKFIKSCEKTSNKLPWQIDLKNFQLNNREHFLFSFDLSILFTLKPKYNNHNNLLHSLSVVFNLDASKKSIDFYLRSIDLKTFINLLSKLDKTCSKFKYKLDYSEFEAKINYDTQKEEDEEEATTTASKPVDMESVHSSYSTISISKEYDLVMMDETNLDDEHCSLSSSSSSSSYDKNDYPSIYSSTSSDQNQKKKQQRLVSTTKKPIRNNKKKEESPVFLIMEREKTEQQVKLNFAFNLALANLTFNLIDLNEIKKQQFLTFQLEKLNAQLDMNNIFQKCEIKLKKFLIYENNDHLNSVIVTTTSTTTNKSLFLDFVFTRALVSNLNKKLGTHHQIKVASETTPLNKKQRVIRSNHQKWITEININMNTIDFYFHFEKFKIIFLFNDLIMENFNVLEQTNSKNCLIPPIIKACDLPLLNININSIRLILYSIKDKNNFLTLQIKSLMATSQLEMPIIRNFDNSNSLNIYNKAKSNGYIYMPGCPFEDRQYSFRISGLSLVNNNSILLNNLNLNAIIALPMFLDNKLINGYSIEINITNDTHFSLSNKSINLILSILNENQTKSSKKEEKYIELVPIEFLITCENLSFSLYFIEQLKTTPLIWIQLVQPHVCLRIHEKTQYFEIQIYDFSIKRANLSSSNTNFNHPNKDDFLISILDTRQGEQNKKNGIINGFLTFKVNNFASLFQSETSNSQLNETTICVCNSCLRCFDFNTNNRNEMLKNSINLEILIERPIKINLNMFFLTQMNQFLNAIDFEPEPTSQEFNILNEFLSINLNANFKSDQIVFIFDLPNKDGSLLLSLNELNLNSTKKSDSINCLNLVIKDFQSKFQTLSFIGPVTLKLNSSLTTENELFMQIIIGSFCFSINRQLINMISKLSLLFQTNETKNENVEEISAKKQQVEIKYEDDLRKGQFKYTIIDNNYIKKNISKNSSHLNSISHIRLPYINEIICVDDFSNNNNNMSNLFSSTVTWRYSKRRLLTSLTIFPLPFIGNDSSTMDSSSMECYLECYNECTKKFLVLKEFYLKEGVFINVIDEETDQLKFFSKCWRIRFSNETKRLVYASSLLASTRVNSIEIDQILLHTHLEMSINNVELTVNNSELAELSVVNLNELNIRLIKNDNRYEINTYGQLGIDFCEYRFLTMQPLVNPFQFKLIYTQFNSNSDLNIQIDSLNTVLSESTLIALKQIESEFKQKEKSALHYYLIHNDTNIQIDVNQYETEETCSIQPGQCLPYAWRTHKKKQLLQLFLPKYKLNCSPFSINNNKSIKQIQFNLTTNHKYVTFIVRIDPDCVDEEMNKIKKNVFIESKLVVCNYLDLDINNLSFTYSFGANDLNEIKITKLEKLSRSNTTYELIEQASSLQINSIEINNKKLLFDNNDQLKQGLVCHDSDLNMKYWLNLYEQTFNNNEIIQYCLILSPLFLFCSYLPYDLNVQFVNNNNNNNANFQSSNLVRSNSISHLFPNKSILLTDKELAIQFDHMSLTNQKKVSHADELNWFDSEVYQLTKLNFNACDYYTEIATKKLKYTKLFKYKLLNDDNDVNQDQYLDDIKFQILKKEKTLSSSSSLDDELIESLSSQVSEKFLVEKSKCWLFSKTIRIDIKPICLMLNKTNYKIQLVEKSCTHTLVSSEFFHDIESNSGQICLSDLSNKMYKLVIESDEYTIKNYDLMKNTVIYESDWFQISDEQSSPFYREQQDLNKCLYSNKCWIDIKLYPKSNNNKQPKLKLIYLILQNDDWMYSSTTRILTIQNKFLLKNKTKLKYQNQIRQCIK